MDACAAVQEAATGQPFCNCWVHNGFVNVNNEKMSKSKGKDPGRPIIPISLRDPPPCFARCLPHDASGNFLTLRDTLRSDLDVRAFRYLVVTSQYRMALNFNAETLEGAKKTVKRLDKLRAALLLARSQAAAEGQVGKAVEEVVVKALEGFEAGMADDLNTPRAAAALFGLVKGAEKMLKAGAASPLSAAEAGRCVAVPAGETPMACP